MSTVHSAARKVLVVGSGTSGLVSALLLRLNGIPVRIIEKSTEHRMGQRGSGIQPRSLELFEYLGVYEQIISRALPIPVIHMYKMPEGVEVLKELHMQPWEEPTPSVPFINTLLLGQHNLEKILRDELAKYECEVELGTELETLVQSKDQVKVTIRKHSGNTEKGDAVEQASYEWVIGADGARGRVRTTLGLKLLGETTPQEYIVGDAEIYGLAEDIWHMWGQMGSAFAAIRSTEDKGIYNYMIGGTFEKSIEEVSSNRELMIDALRKVTGQRQDIKVGRIEWASPYRLGIRMTNTFRCERVFLVGDAGHIHSPTGGQGMNTGVQDAFNLGWKLALVIREAALESLLDTYNEERIPVVSSMLNITTDILKKTVVHRDDAGWDRTGQIKQLGVNYRWSSIVIDEGSHPQEEGNTSSAYGSGEKQSLMAGDRAPDAANLVEIRDAATQNTRTLRLFQLFMPNKHTVIFFTDKADYRAGLAVLQTYPADYIQSILIAPTGESITDMPLASTDGLSVKIVQDSEGHAVRSYIQDTAFCIFIIRPDGMIGARATSVDGIITYFRGVFGK